MKQLFIILFLILFFVSRAQTPCKNGMAGEYPCSNYDLLSHIPVATLANSLGKPNGSDIWGWTDSTTNKEYAICAMTNSTAFVDITDPVNPVFLGRLNSNAGNNVWRDVKVYKNHAFIVADKVGKHGMQVFDLTKLRSVSNPPKIFTSDAVYAGVESCHNIVINEDKGVAYLVGCASTNGGGPVFVDISNPKNPTLLGQYTALGYSHDAQVVTYDGPDTAYKGKEIYIGSNQDVLVVLDVTDKKNVVKLGTADYSQIGYTHQGWFTDDHKYFIVGDETDEQKFGMNTRTLIFDLQDLNNPKLSSTHFGSNSAIDHNGYVKGNKFFMASYRAGMRVFNIDNIGASSNPMSEIGYFDTYPADNKTAFNGAWSVYPYFKSGNIVINDIERGFFVVRKSKILSVEEDNVSEMKFSITPNPSKENPTILGAKKNIKSVVVYNVLGRKIFSKQNINQTSFVIPISNQASGIYIVKINNIISKKLILK